MTLQPYASLPLDQGEVSYAYGPDSFPRPGVEPGRIDRFTIDDSTAYPGTTRSVWVHVPAGHDPLRPAPVMLFNDGWWYLDPEGDVRAGVVLDNLAAQGAIPSAVGVFVDPGIRTASEEPKNRNVEYDAADDRSDRAADEEACGRTGHRARRTTRRGGDAKPPPDE